MGNCYLGSCPWKKAFVKVLNASLFCLVRVPKVTLNVGGAISDENYTMCGPSFDPRNLFIING